MYRPNVSSMPASQPCSTSSTKSIFCVTCLTSSLLRKMYPIGDPLLFSSVTMIKLPPVCNFMVCFECNAMLMKIKKFRMKALKAQSILRKNRVHLTSLTTLKQTNLIHWLSIDYNPQLEISPLIVNTQPKLPETRLKAEIVESETLRPGPVDLNSTERDPFGDMVKTETGVQIENESCMDVIKCEFDSNTSSDDEPLQAHKNNVSYLEMEFRAQRSSSGTESASDVENPLNNIILKPMTSSSNMPVQSTFPVPKPAQKQNNPSIELPLAFVASSVLLNNLKKSTDSDVPVEYHTGPKLFKNSPQLTIPKMFRSTELSIPAEPANTENTYVVRTLTEEEVFEYRAERLKHARSRLYLHYCENCLERYSKKVDFDTHMKKHDKLAGPFMCGICELRFTTQQLLDEHKAEHYKIYICEPCNMEFYNLKGLLRHNTMKHQDILKFCRACDARFTNLREYYRHNQIHKRKKECNVCHEEVESRSYKKHMAKHIEEPMVKCDVCQKEFRGRNRMLHHKRNSHMQADDGGYCVECNISFRTQNLFKVHMKTLKHIPDSEKFICQQCNKPYPSLWGLNKHISVAHENSERSECDICKKVYQCKKAIRTHIVTKHLKLRTTLTKKICDICGKTFDSKSCLDQHMNSHLKIRPYACEECGATFSYSGARYTHIKLKHRKNKGKSAA